MFHLMNVASICLTIQLRPFFETWCLGILTVNLRDAHVENVPKSFQTPTSSCQLININRFLYTTITTARPPIAAVERPGSLSTSTIPCTTLPPPLCSSIMLPSPATALTTTLKGWRSARWVGRRGKDTGRMTTTQCATHTLCCLVIFIFNSSMLIDDAACNPHAVSSILLFFLTFPCRLMMRCATHMPRHLFLSFPIFPYCLTMRRANPHAALCIFFNFSILFDDAVCNPHAMSSIPFISNFSMLFDNTVCNPHAASFIYFYFCYIVWSLNVECWLNTYKVYIVCL